MFPVQPFGLGPGHGDRRPPVAHDECEHPGHQRDHHRPQSGDEPDQDGDEQGRVIAEACPDVRGERVQGAQGQDRDPHEKQQRSGQGPGERTAHDQVIVGREESQFPCHMGIREDRGQQRENQHEHEDRQGAPAAQHQDPAQQQVDRHQER